MASLRAGPSFLRSGWAAALAGPEILLMDEPFGAVDEITRGQLQEELHKIHRENGITILFVTHDIDEALKLGTRVLVLDQGQIQQCDAPAAVLRQPATKFVADLVNQQRRFQDRTEEYLISEVDQVRKHQEMLKRLLDD